MNDFLQALWSNPWWTFQSDSAGFWSYLYRSFNLIEGIFWVAFAAIVLRRYLLHRKSLWEVIYAVVFFIFGLTDFVEANEMSAPLLVAKAVILVALFTLRHHVHRRYYPAAWY